MRGWAGKEVQDVRSLRPSFIETSELHISPQNCQVKSMEYPPKTEKEKKKENRKTGAGAIPQW